MTKRLLNGIVVDLTEDEIREQNERITAYNDSAFDRSIFNLREKRNSLLQETDWWGASDNTMTAEQTQYRQDLRDITNGLTTEEEVKAVVFPTKPSE